MPKLPLAVAAALLAAGAATAQTGEVEISGAWARATPAKAETGAAYMTLKAAAADRLVDVSTPVADRAGLHEMKMEGSVMKMRPLAALELPAGRPVALKPSGTHIMLEGLHQQLEAGQSILLTLKFEKAGIREVTIPVEKR